MASSIDASTSGAGGVITTADNTGILQLKSGGTTIATVSSTGLALNTGNITLPSGAAPTFSAYSSASQSTSSNVFLKVACGTEEWDTNSNYDNTTNYRFTPTVAGYYQVNCFIALNAATTRLIASIYKNGSQIKKVFDLGDVAAVANGGGSAIVYCNGSTDYLELYARTANANSVISSGGETMFQAALIRSA